MRGRGAPWWGQASALVAAFLLAAGSLLYSHRQIEALRDETRNITRSFAELIGHVATDTTGVSSPLDLAVSRFLTGYDFPYVVTDTDGRPLAWRGLGLEPGLTGEEAREEAAVRARAFDQRYQPIPLEVPGSDQVFHYGDPPEVRSLRTLPWIQVGLLGLVLALVWWSLRAGLQRQRSLLWVGLARESAHQFGTPLSSLQGWMRLLSEREPAHEDRSGPSRGPATGEILEAMEEDVERLSRITSRFAKIGGPPDGDPVDVAGLVGRSVDYVRRRAPQRGARVEIVEEIEAVPPVRGQEELLEWVVENLMKNALDALGGEPGTIRLRVSSGEGRSVRIEVEDDGRGIAPGDQRRIFDPGFSTKRRGWGLGLSLSRRLTEAHGGRLQLVRSRPGEGSLFELTLPAAREEGP
ncbi:MAG: HAMP domain-containing sensor histidine kinase [bacterium]